MGTTTKLSSTTETERKYEPAGPAAPAAFTPELTAAITGALPGAGPVAAVRDLGTTELAAVYFDTKDRRLAADGITLRRRTGGDDAGWHLKLPLPSGEGDTREEIRAPLAATPPGTPPEALAALVRSRTRRAPLAPLLTVRTERARHQLLDDHGAPLAELALDQVTAERAGRTARWSEAEVELAEGTAPALLDTVGKRLAAAGLRRSAAASKLHRALAETAPETSPRGAQEPTAFPGDSAGAHVLAYARRQLRAIVELDPAVRRERPDAVHQMRVATRRLRSCFRSFRAVWDPDATGAPADELRWLAAGLGADRDREVLAERLAARVSELPPSLLIGPVRRRLRTVTRARRADTRRRLLAVLDGERYLALLDALTAVLDGSGLREAAAARPAPKVLGAAVRRDRKRLAARIDAALALPPGPERDIAVHDARKAAKRARYAAEAARRALGKAAKAQIAEFSAVQEVLGDHQDSVLALAALPRIAAEAQRAGEPSFSYGVLYEREAARAAASERALAGLL